MELAMYFVMLRHQNGKPIQLERDDSGFPALFETEEEAEQAGENNLLGEHFGFEVYEWV